MTDDQGDPKPSPLERLTPRHALAISLYVTVGIPAIITARRDLADRQPHQVRGNHDVWQRLTSICAIATRQRYGFCGSPVSYVPGVDGVIVIQDHHDVAGDGVEVIEQRGEDRLDHRWPRRLQERERVLADTRRQGLQRGDQVRPERHRPVMAGIE